MLATTQASNMQLLQTSFQPQPLKQDQLLRAALTPVITESKVHAESDADTLISAEESVSMNGLIHANSTAAGNAVKDAVARLKPQCQVSLMLKTQL